MLHFDMQTFCFIVDIVSVYPCKCAHNCNGIYSPQIVTSVSWIEILLSKFIFFDLVVMCLRQIVNTLGVSYFTAVNLRTCDHKVMHWLVNNAQMNREVQFTMLAHITSVEIMSYHSNRIVSPFVGSARYRISLSKIQLGNGNTNYKLN